MKQKRVTGLSQFESTTIAPIWLVTAVVIHVTVSHVVLSGSAKLARQIDDFTLKVQEFRLLLFLWFAHKIMLPDLVGHRHQKVEPHHQGKAQI